MATIDIRGVPVSFPFQPYDIQKNYMEKVIEALQNEQNAVLESPTGTGKTLSLLCSSLAWLVQKKSQYQASGHNLDLFSNDDDRFNAPKSFKPPTPKFMWDVPKIIYSSRTHSQLTQAMQELKRTSYSHVKASILGSRHQMCIHPEISKEVNTSNKIHMCRALVKARSCFLQNRVEKMSCSPEINGVAIVDIEDLVKMGQKNKFCPYYMSRELQKQADIIFLPYNYLLDPKARRSQQLDLKNSVVILDEAHNVEHICEDSASFQIKSTDITLCIEEVTQVMKQMDENAKFANIEDMDFSPDELIFLKTTLLNLEKVIDEIPINSTEGTTYEGKYIFEIFENAGINDESQGPIIALLDKIIQLLSTAQESPFQRSGSGLQVLQDLMLIVYQKISTEFKDRINQCYKVHLIVEDKENKKKPVDNWLSKASSSKSKQGCRVLSYWCFSPGFGMQMLLELGVRTVILTSGTLAPLRPLISELGMNVEVRLENPHVISKQQICVKILSSGPDGVELNACYQNRSNINYIMSLGMTIINISRTVPHGMLIFFPSYPVLAKCQEEWQASEIWSSINRIKPVYVEPKTKDAFINCMKEFYEKVNSLEHKGAIFMAVCRGKVSEGLDFADINGRAVLITGLPYPPLRDPRIMLKRKYLDVLHSRDKEYLSGQDWYSLEASRAVNQAIGRVIRHQYDYGAILLLDSRFNNSKIKSQMSLWLRDLIHPVKNFGEIIRDLRIFFKQAAEKFPLAEKPVRNILSNSEEINYLTTPSHSTSDSSSSSLVTIHKPLKTFDRQSLKRKFKMIDVNYAEQTVKEANENVLNYINDIRQDLDKREYANFTRSISNYRNNSNMDEFIDSLDAIFKDKPKTRLMLEGLLPYIKIDDREKFNRFCEKMKIL